MAESRSYDGVSVTPRGATDTLPLDFEVRTTGKGLFFGLLKAGAIGVLALYIDELLPAGTFGEYGPLIQDILPVLLWVAAALQLLATLFRQFTRTGIHITSGHVTVKKRSPIGVREWSEPLSAYRGIRWKRFAIVHHSRQTGGRGSPRWRNVLELAHSNEDRCLPLEVFVTGRADAGATLSLVGKAFAAKDASKEGQDELRAEAERLGRQSSGDHLRGQWESLSSLLGLPAIDAREGEEIVREVDNLDKSVRQLAEEGKVETGWSASSPPQSLELQQQNDGTQDIVIRVSSVPLVIPAALGIVGGIMIMVGLVTMKIGTVFGGALFVGAALLIHHLAKVNPRRLRIVDGELRYEDSFNRRRSFVLPLADIESIEVRDRDPDLDTARTLKLGGKQLRIATDERERVVGGGLPEEALQWLRGYLMNAAANA